MKRHLFFIILSAAVSIGQANAQTLDIDNNTTRVTSDQTGRYDRVIVQRTLLAGHTYGIVFPSELDGYYFGPDAERRSIDIINENDFGQFELSAVNMKELDNFKPGQAYLITPVQDMDSIIHMTPGIKTKVPAAINPLYCIDMTDKIIELDPEEIREHMNAPYYDILGRKFDALPASKGIYIHMGEKILVE